MYLLTVADFSTVPFPIPAEEFVVAGYYAEGDGGGGTFVWVPQAIQNGDDGIVFLHPNDTHPNGPGGSGYFQRQYSGPINVRWFGAIKDATDPNPPSGYPNAIFDVTPYVHRARDSRHFANNGTLYFPKGIYPGAFEFCSVGNSGSLVNEISIIGDGQGSVLTSNGEGFKDNPPFVTLNPIVKLGFRHPHWNMAKFSDLTIDGNYNGNRHVN